MSAEAKEEKASKPKTRKPKLRRKAGQSRTILLYPLNNSIKEADIEEFVKRASLSSPIRIELFNFQSSTNNDKTNTNNNNEDIDTMRKDQNENNTLNFNTYAYCTFTSSTDCWLIKKHLNNKLLNNHKVQITFSAISRTDLEGLTNVIEFTTDYPPITEKKQIYKFLNNYNNTNNLSLICKPKSIKPAPGHGGIKGKWYLSYDSPEIATKALEFYSGKYYFDTENNCERFIIINYQLHRNLHPTDRKACFYGITDRIILRNLNRDINDNDDILLFLQSNGFNVNRDIFDIYIIHQLTHIIEKQYNKRKQAQNHKKFKPKKGYAIITFANYKLAIKAYTNLNNKYINDKCKIMTAFDSPKMTDPLKKILKDNTNVIHINNLPWNVSKEQMREWLAEAGKKYNENNNNKLSNDVNEVMEVEKDKNDLKNENPFYNTDEINNGKINTEPISIHIKYRDGYTTGRANATFATNEEANIVVEMLNGKELGGRKICINWALPIKESKFKQQRNIALNLRSERNNKRFIKGDNKQKKKKGNVDEIDMKEEESVAFRKIRKWQAQRKGKRKEKQGNGNEKRGMKRKQSFDSPSTKKIKLTL